MTEFLAIFRREIIYIWYYFDVQFRQIFWYWILGMLIGSFISVFSKDENSANAPFGKRPHIVPESAGRSAIGDAVCAKFARKALNNLYDCYNRYPKRRFSVIISEILPFVFSAG